MATIYMSNYLWEIKLTGIKVDNIKYPLIEIYCDFGNTSLLNNTLDFGSARDTFGPALRLKLLSIGNPWVISSISQPVNSETPISARTVTDENFSILQTVSTNAAGTYQRTYVNVFYDNKSLTSEVHVARYGESFGNTYSPLCFIHNTHDNTVLCTNTTYSSTHPTFYDHNVEPINMINGIGVGSGKSQVEGSANQHFFFYCIGLANYDDIAVKIYPDTPDSDPWSPNNIFGGVGGDGETQTPDSITDPALPTISSVDTGFITLYKPTISQLNSLATYMWGSLDLDVFKKLFATPMDAILGLSILPGIVPNGNTSHVILGNIDTGISMIKISTQYVKLDMGTVTINKKWGAFLDYSPYTRAFIYLPFIGIRPIDVDSIMDVSVQVKYNIDVMSGACCAFVIANGTTLYSFVGQCACSVPIVGRDWTNVINGIIGTVANVAGGIASAVGGNVAGLVGGVASAAQSIIGAKPQIEHSGSMGSMGGLMGIKRPYVIIERPVQAVPSHQNAVLGYPSFIYMHIGDLKGYNEFEQIHLENIPCTSDELDEIENILLTGVII